MKPNIVLAASAAFIYVLTSFSVASLGETWNGFSTDQSINELPVENCTFSGKECMCLLPTAPPTEQPDVDLFTILTKGSEYLKNYTDENEAVLFLGNTGTGKTTVTQIIAGDLSKLHAVSESSEVVQLIILDEDDRIGPPSTNSKTLFPEMIVKFDEGGRLPVFDFPGFDDTRGSDEDIAANFFMTEVAKKVTNFKLLFVVTHPEVSGNDRILFNKLVEHATTFVKDISKFSNSFGLIVNKVKNYNDFGEYFEDDAVITGIVNFLTRYNATTYEDYNNAKEEDKEKIKKKLVFVETLLKNETGSYSNIWFVRNPLQCGPLSEHENVLDTRENITQMINRLTFTRVNHDSDEEAFGFTLKPETVDIIKNYTDDINTAVTSANAEISADFKLWFYHTKQNLAKQGESIERMNDYFWKLKNSADSLKKELDDVKSSSVTLEGYANLISTFYKEVGQLLSAKYIDFMILQDTFLNFFDKAAIKRHDRFVERWKEPLTELSDFLANFARWYLLCKNLENKISTMEFHMKSYPTKDANTTWLNFIIENNIETVSPETITSSMFVQPEDLTIIERLMNQALEGVTQSCDQNRKIVSFRGNFIKLGEFVGQLDQAIRGCGATEVEFIAGQAIFFDQNVSFPGVNFAFISPNIDQSYNIPFLLDVQGQPGANPSTSRAEDGQPGSPGGHGVDAEAGNPGDPSGNTFLVANKVLGGATGSIIIDTSGGNGGAGQEGGHGGYSEKRSDCKCFKGERGAWDKPTSCAYDSNDDYTKCTCPASQGYLGGNGGNGGKGGKPGSKGTSSVLTFTSETMEAFSLIALDGITGDAGSGGQGGTGGESGAGYVDTTATCYAVTLPRGENGISGATGNSTKNQKNPKSPPPKVSEWNAILHFRMNFFNYESHDTSLLLHEIDASDEAEPLFTLKALAEESLSLEQVDRSNVNQIRLKDMYLSLLRKLERYYQKLYQSLSKQEQKVLSVLLTSSSSFTTNLDSSFGTDIVVDISNYLEDINSTIIELKKLTDRDQFKNAIDVEKQQLASDLSSKIYYSRAFIFDEVNPALFSAQNVLQSKADLLEDQIAGFIEDTESLENVKRKLAEAEKLQRTSRSLKGFALLSNLIKELYIPVDLFEEMVQSLEGKYNATQREAERLVALKEVCLNQFEDLNEKANQFGDDCVPLFNSLLDYFDRVETLINSDEEVIPFSYMGGNPLRKLKECKYVLEEFAEDSFNVKPLVNAFNRMQNTLTFSIDLYSMIEYFIETQDLARYVALMQSSALKEEKITDPDYLRAVENFDTNIKKNLLDKELKKAVHSFKQWVFPFADFYLESAGQLNQPKLMAPGDDQLRQIESLQQNLASYKARPEGERDTIVQLNFTNAINTSKAFYTWDNENWGPQIELLLSGNQVSFEADIRNIGLEGWEAIKFKQIEIIPRMKGGTEGMRKDFDDAIIDFNVTMTHSGVSHYRFLQEYFVMTGGAHTIQYDFRRDDDGNRKGTNEVYEKFKSGDFMLSPYTVWTIQFRNITASGRKESSLDFEQLKRFAPYIDLELEGIGTYVKGPQALNAAGGDMKLDKHYERDDSYKTDFKFKTEVTRNDDDDDEHALFKKYKHKLIKKLSKA